MTTPPSHLSSESQAWFAKVVETFDLTDSQRLLLQSAAENWDRAQAAREVLTNSGMSFQDRHGNYKARPEVQIARDCQGLFLRIMRTLSLDSTP